MLYLHHSSPSQAPVCFLDQHNRMAQQLYQNLSTPITTCAMFPWLILLQMGRFFDILLKKQLALLRSRCWTNTTPPTHTHTIGKGAPHDHCSIMEKKEMTPNVQVYSRLQSRERKPPTSFRTHFPSGIGLSKERQEHSSQSSKPMSDQPTPGRCSVAPGKEKAKKPSPDLIVPHSTHLVNLRGTKKVHLQPNTTSCF